MHKTQNKHDRTVKLCVINDVMLNSDNIGWRAAEKDDDLKKYLQIEKQDYFRDVALKDIKSNSAQPINPVKLMVHDTYLVMINDSVSEFNASNTKCEKCCNGLCLILVGCLTFMMGPIYLLSRLFNVFFPFGIVLYLYFALNINFL